MNYDEELKKIDPDLQFHIYKKWYNSMQLHDKASGETKDMINGLNCKIDRICDCLFGIPGDEKSGVVKAVSRIEAHAEYTNGRVTKLELWQAGVIGVSSLLVFAVPSLAWYFWNRTDEMRDNIMTHIAKDEMNFNKLIQ